jgi:hypothetical protein
MDQRTKLLSVGYRFIRDFDANYLFGHVYRYLDFDPASMSRRKKLYSEEISLKKLKMEKGWSYYKPWILEDSTAGSINEGLWTSIS